MNELKPCPFCGSNDFIERDNRYQGSSVLSYWIVCRHCGSESKAANNLAAAHDAWNMRAESAELAALHEQVKMLREALEDAKKFIKNGYDMGYIAPPDPDLDDLAHRTYPKMRKALEQTKPKD